MRSVHWLAALVVVGCGGTHVSPFDTDSGTGNDAGVGNDASGCPFCGVDGGNSDGAPTCDPNPANYDIPGNGCDDDGDGIIDNPQGTCDTGLPTTSPSATQFSKAIGICPGKGDTWGVTSATYTQGVGSTAAPMAQQYGDVATFGTNVPARQGSVLGILSSGVAAAMDCGDGQDKGNVCSNTGPGSPPTGYPKAATGCPISNVANDVVDVVLKIQVPANAKGFTFDFNFYSGEWPEWVCTEFNDSFVAWLTSTAWMGKAGDFNISFDAKNNPVSVNNAFFETCTSNAPTGCCSTTTAMGCGSPTATASCINGPGQLAGTGFEDNGTYCQNPSTGGGSTGWLTTKAPAKPGEVITLQFIIWDTGDPNWDSSVLLDNFKWVRGPTTTGTQPAQ